MDTNVETKSDSDPVVTLHELKDVEGQGRQQEPLLEAWLPIARTTSG